MRNLLFGWKWLIAALVLIPALVACNDDNDDDSDNGSAGKHGYLFSLRTQGADGTTDYIWKLDNIDQLMSGELSVDGVGVEQAGWNYNFGLANSFFSINYGDEGTTAYGLSANGNIKVNGRFYVDRLDCMGVADEENMIGNGAPWGGGSYDCEFMVINSSSISITARKFNNFAQQHGDVKLNRWPTGALVRDNKIYVPFYPLVGDTWETPIMDTAYIGVYEYPSLNYIATLKDARTAPIGMYGSQPSIFKTESGDIYTFSPASYASGYTKVDKPSAILRIKNGQEGFDPDYYFNFEESAVEGKIVFGSYLGNGKALVRYIPASTDNTEKTVWAATDDTKIFFKMAIVDLENKTATAINDIPLHGGGWSRGPFIEDGIAYHDISTDTEVRIYAIDIAKGTATKGALVKGRTVPLIHRIEY